MPGERLPCCDVLIRCCVCGGCAGRKAAMLRCADTVPRLRRARRDISEVKKGQALQNGKDETDGRYWT